MLREDYLKKIKEARNPAEKDQLIEDMGRRLAHVEKSLAAEKAQ